MKTKLLAAFLLVVGFPVVGLAQPKIEVTPLAHDFGNVQVGDSSTTIVNIANVGGHPLTIMIVGMEVGSSPDFSVTSAPSVPFILNPGDSVDVEITFEPSAEGVVSAQLVIWSDSYTSPPSHHVNVELTGFGVPVELPPDEQIQDILDFIDDSVEAGDLSGSGPGNSANGRLNALKNMIEAAGDLIEDGDYETAFDQLNTLYEKCDGETPPPDFVEGEARGELAGMISDLMAVLLLLMM